MSDSMRWTPSLLAVVAAMAALVTTSARPAPVLCAGHWAKVADEGPPGRFGNRLAYDSARQRIVMFGGFDDRTRQRFGDTWEWDGSVWTQVASVGPSGRAHHGMAFDSVRNKVVLFGGQGTPSNPDGDNNDTWEWDGIAWQDVSGANKRPVARNGHGMAYDSFRQKMVMFGGGITFDGRLGDTWALGEDMEWHARPMANGPAGHMPFSGMAYDRERRVVVQYSTGDDYREPGTWTWNGDTWSQESGAQPIPPRIAAGLAYDSARHRTVLYGGSNAPNEGPTGTWEWDGADWQQVATTGPGPRTDGGLMAYDRDLGKVVLFGGATLFDHTMNDTWTWSGPTYRCGVPIAGDINCDGIVDVDDGRIVVTGRGRPACAADDTRDLDGDGRITWDDKRQLDALCTFDGCARSDMSTDD